MLQNRVFACCKIVYLRYTGVMESYRKRLIDSIVEKKLKANGAVLIRGPRAVGKTTTALHHAASFVRLDESAQVLRQAEVTPHVLLQGDVPRLIDEWQLAPSLWNIIRGEIDKRSKPGQFILTGSAAPADDKSRHTGAGRFSRITLRPMALAESGESTREVNFNNLFEPAATISGFGGPTVEDYAGLIVRGGWPALTELTPTTALEALIDYVDNLVAVDLRTIDNRPDPMRIAALIRALARNISTEATLEKLAKEADIFDSSLTAQTARRYLDQLARIFVLDELPAWRTHIQSSIQLRVKPKWHFVDPSLATAALRIAPEALLDDLTAMGLFFESLAVRDLRAYADTVGAALYHYRDSTNLEIDIIVERFDGKWLAVEVKLGGESAIEEAVSNFEKLERRLTEQKLSKLMSRVILTAGVGSYAYNDKITVISLGHLFV
jgi:predicted AAA+ superfamily ATPase